MSKLGGRAADDLDCHRDPLSSPLSSTGNQEVTLLHGSNPAAFRNLIRPGQGLGTLARLKKALYSLRISSWLKPGREGRLALHLLLDYCFWPSAPGYPPLIPACVPASD